MKQGVPNLLPLTFKGSKAAIPAVYVIVAKDLRVIALFRSNLIFLTLVIKKTSCHILTFLHTGEQNSFHKSYFLFVK